MNLTQVLGLLFGAYGLYGLSNAWIADSGTLLLKGVALLGIGAILFIAGRKKKS